MTFRTSRFLHGSGHASRNSVPQLLLVAFAMMLIASFSFSATSAVAQEDGSEKSEKSEKSESAERVTPEHIESWRGTLNAGSMKLEMGLQVYRANDGTLSAELDSYSQNVTGMPIDFQRDGNTYKIKQDRLKVVCDLELNEAKDKLSGIFNQGGAKLPLELSKVEVGEKPPEANRPQHPKEPFPYDVSEVSYENEQDSVTLAGTLTTPRGDGPFPAVIMISGSGPQDRNETIFEHKPFLVIADHLTRKGIAVLRFDDRGVGKSTGSFATSTSEDFARDVEAGIEFLKSNPKIDSEKIGLAGHSEGGVVAPMVAVNRSDVAFIVMLAGTGVDGEVIVASQSRAMTEISGVKGEFLDHQDKLMAALCAQIKSKSENDISKEELGKTGAKYIATVEDEAMKTQLNAVNDALSGQFASPWFGFFIKHDPAPVLQKVKCPVLAMNGEKDLQVLVDLNLNAIEKALKAGGNSNFQISRLKDMNHLFQETEGPGMPTEYGTLEETFSPKALTVMSDWLLEQTKD